jgi:hypothetical protein
MFCRYILRWNFICFSIRWRKTNIIESWVRRTCGFNWLFKWDHTFTWCFVFSWLRLITGSCIRCIATSVRTFLRSICPIQLRITINQMSIGLDWLLRLDLLWSFGSILYALDLFYILKLQQLLIDGVFHNLILYYQLLNITSWNIHLLLIIKIVSRLCIEWPMSILSCLDLDHLLLLYENWLYRRKITI